MTDQEQPPRYMYTHCLSYPSHSTPEENTGSPCRHRCHRGEFHCSETRNSSAIRHRQPACHHHQDQPQSHCHQPHSIRRHDSNHPSFHVSSLDDNPSCTCHDESAPPSQPPQKECSCQPRPKHTTHKSRTQGKGHADTGHCHTQKPSMREEHGTRWVWGPPLPAIVLGHPVRRPRYERG